MGKIVVKRPQPVVLEDTFAVWRDKINAGILIETETADQVNREIDRLDDKIDKACTNAREEAEAAHGDIYNTINEGDKILNKKIDNEIKELHDKIDLDVMGLIIALG